MKTLKRMLEEPLTWIAGAVLLLDWAVWQLDDEVHALGCAVCGLASCACSGMAGMPPPLALSSGAAQ